MTIRNRAHSKTCAIELLGSDVAIWPAGTLPVAVSPLFTVRANHTSIASVISNAFHLRHARHRHMRTLYRKLMSSYRGLRLALPFPGSPAIPRKWDTAWLVHGQALGYQAEEISAGTDSFSVRKQSHNSR